MQLTGKCKEDFLKFYWITKISKSMVCKEKDSERFFNSTYIAFQQSVIAEFLDWHGIHIVVKPSLHKWDFVIYDEKLNVLGHGFLDHNRQESTAKAIEYANKLYNEK